MGVSDTRMFVHNLLPLFFIGEARGLDAIDTFNPAKFLQYKLLVKTNLTRHFYAGPSSRFHQSQESAPYA